MNLEEEWAKNFVSNHWRTCTAQGDESCCTVQGQKRIRDMAINQLGTCLCRQTLLKLEPGLTPKHATSWIGIRDLGTASKRRRHTKGTF